MEWKPNTPYNTTAFLKNPTGSTVTKGVKRNLYPDKGERLYVSFRTFGGTEKTSNGQIVVENTGVVETWYRPDITSESRFVIDDLTYEVLGTPENINKRNRNVVMKVRAVKGGA